MPGLGGFFSKGLNHLADERLAFWNRKRKNKPIVPELTKAELEQENQRRLNQQREQQ